MINDYIDALVKALDHRLIGKAYAEKQAKAAFEGLKPKEVGFLASGQGQWSERTDSYHAQQED